MVAWRRGWPVRLLQSGVCNAVKKLSANSGEEFDTPYCLDDADC